MKKKLVFFLCLVFAIISCSCQNSEAASGDKPLIYTSFYPVHSLTKSVVGNTVNLQSFMPLDKDPHIWEPSPRDIKRLQSADMLIVNGANMESWLEDIKSTLPDLKILNLSDSVELITYKGAAAIGDFQYMSTINVREEKNGIRFGHTHEDLIRIAFVKNDKNYDLDTLIKMGKKAMNKGGKLVKQGDTIKVEDQVVYGIEMGHESGFVYFDLPDLKDWIFISDRVSEPILSYSLVDSKGKKLKQEVLMDYSTSNLDKISYDPHSWLSIVNAKKYLQTLQDEFSEMYPKYKRTFRKNKLKIASELTTLQYEFSDKFKAIERKEFIVTHNAYSYLARDFNLTQFPLQNLVSMEEPSLKTLKTAIDFCKVYNIHTLFYEYGQPPKGAATIAGEIDGEILPLASMEFIVLEQKRNDEQYIDLMRKNLENLHKSMEEQKN